MWQVRLREFSLHKMKITCMGIELPALGQHGPTKFIVWIFGGQSTVPPLCFSWGKQVVESWIHGIHTLLCFYYKRETSSKLLLIATWDMHAWLMGPSIIGIIHTDKLLTKGKILWECRKICKCQIYKEHFSQIFMPFSNYLNFNCS